METNTEPISPELVSRIIAAVEQTFGRRIKTPKDFDELRLSIYERTATLLSPSTLKRVWGYIAKVPARTYTLDTLCRYSGWANLEAMMTSSTVSESGPLVVERIDMADDVLSCGEKITIAWLPDRKIEVEYLGNASFKILSALNTRLQTGDTFTAGLIAKDQPLYLDRLTRNGIDLGVYVCGRNSGIRFILPFEKNQ